ncbi:MAG: type I restriction enzyme HsdR N-terminal domain-containing protein [Bacteroidales bacterium]
MKELNLPAYSFKLKENSEGQKMIFDRVRKRFVVLTPEEWVRQHFVNFLVNHRDYPAGLLGVEVMFRMNELSRRVDIMVYNNVGNPLLAVECKAPGVKISGEVFDQVVEYNMKFRLNYLLVTNGISHSGCRIDWENNSYTFLDRIPFYNELI